jgi:hypothetical protein
MIEARGPIDLAAAGSKDKEIGTPPTPLRLRQDSAGVVRMRPTLEAVE